MYTLGEVMAIVWTLWSLAFSTTIARVVLRWRIQGTFYGEDYLAFLSFLFFTGLTGVVVAVTPMFDMSRNYLIAASNDPLTPTPLPLEDFTAQTITALKLMFAQMLLFWSTLWAGKFSLLIFFRKMVLGLPKYLHIWWLVFTLVIVTYLACMLSNVLTCVPLKKYWSATGCSAPEDLKRSDASIKFATAADIFADFLIMLLPLRLLFTLQISLKQKFGLACLFSLGSIVIVFAFVRLFNVTKATAQSQIDPTTLADGPVILSLWSTIEAGVAVIVANLPAFRSFLKNRGQTRGSSGKPGGSDPYARSKSFRSGRNTSQGAIIERGVELESLHSVELDVGKGMVRGGVKELTSRDILMTRHISVQSSRRIELEANSQWSKWGLALHDVWCNDGNESRNLRTLDEN